MALYHYPYKSTTEPIYCFSDDYQTPDFQQGGYETYGGGLFAEASNIFDINLEIRLQEMCTPTLGNLPSDFNYGETFTISNFTMLLTGYFYADVSGNYTFNLVADDLAYLSFGAGSAFECCREAGTVNKPNKFDLIIIWNGADQMSGSVSYELEGGVYYPIRLLYANRDYHGDLKLSFVDPSGTLQTSFMDHIYQFPDDVRGCAKQITTTTRPGTVLETTTVATSMHTITGADGLDTIETIFVVETPSVETDAVSRPLGGGVLGKGSTIYTTTYTHGTAGITTTYSTTINVFEGTDGELTTETVYFVETPSSPLNVETATTVFTPGTAGITTTYSTATNVITGSDGGITTETVYLVETPSSPPNVETTTTIFTPGTAGITTTYSTATNVITGPDGGITTETIYFVETPSMPPNVETETTIFTPGTIGITTTYSTSTNIFTGPDGGITTETIYYVQTPTPGAIPTAFATTVSDTTIPIIAQPSSIRRSSTLAGQFRYPTKGASSTASVGVTQYQGNGSNRSQKMYSFIFGLCFSFLLM